MASIESEVLDPAAAIDRFRRAASELALSRRNFLGLGVAGAAVAGAGLLSTPAIAQEPLHNGYPQVDVLNLLLQVKYVTATLYSYITQGADLPPSSGVTVGTAQVYNAPGKITFTAIANGPTAQQLTDMFNEMYYDELNHVIDLRNLIESASSGQPAGGTAVVGRANLNLLGNSNAASTPSSLTSSMTQSQAIAIARLLEDLSVSAAAGAVIYLSGTNLAYVTQMMAADGFHAGAVRLVAIQGGAQYQSSEYSFGSVTTSAETLSAIPVFTTAGSGTMYAMSLGSVVPAVGNIITGPGIPAGPGGVIKAVNSVSNAALTGITTKGSTTISNLSSVSGIAVGQPVTGAGTSVPANAYVTAVGANSITISAAAAVSSTVSPTGAVVSGSPTILGVSSLSGVIVGQPITGTGIPANATIVSTTSSPATITMSANATSSSTVTVQGVVTSGSKSINNVPNLTGVTVGLPISGPGIPAATTVTAASGTTITISNAATASTGVAFTGTLATGSNVISAVSSVTGLSVGQTAIGSGIPAGATITAIGTNTVTISANATTSGSVNVAAAAASLVASTTEALSTPTTEAITVGLSSITIAGTAPTTSAITVNVIAVDPMDVEPGDPGSASASAAGPQAIAGSSPTVYQGFFNTAGSGTSSSTGTPAGLVFARNFSQVLQVLLGTNSTNSLVTNQSSEGGFYPYGVSGTINSIQPS